MKHVMYAFLSIVLLASSATGFDQLFLRDTPAGSDRVTAVTFSDDGRHLAYGTDDGRVAVVHMADGSSMFSSGGHDEEISSLIFDSRAAYLVSGSHDDRIIIWNIADGEPVKVIDTFGDDITALDISPDGRYLAACGSKKEIALWEFPGGFPRGELKAHDKDAVHCAFSGDGSRLVSVGEDKRIIVWDLKRLKPLRQNEIAAHTLANSGLDIVSAEMSDDRRFLAIGIEEHVLAKGSRRMEFRYNIAFYDWTTGTLLKILEGNNRPTHRLALSPDMTYLITDNSPMHSHELAFWDILGGIIETSYPIEGDVADFDMAMDGRYLAVAYAHEDEGAHIATWELTGIAGYSPPASGGVTQLAETGFGATVSLTGPEEPVITDDEQHSLAVMYLTAYGIDDGIARMITDDLEGRLVNTAPCLRIIERNRIELILTELKYVQSGMTDGRAIEIGEHLEAEYLLYGSVRKTGHDLSVSVKVAHVESAQILGSRGVLCANASLRDVFDMVRYLAPTIVDCSK